jgi:hypothetical protein
VINDVLLLSFHFYSKMTSIDELWFQMGSITSVKDGRQFIPVHDLYNSLGAEMANILPVAHSLTGCDLSAKNLFTITDIVFGKLHHRLLVMKITSQENFTFSDRDKGKSNTIFSSSITVSEAIHAANNLKAELKFTELETNFENTQSKQLE